MYDDIVIGGGLSGLLVALELRAAGRSVCLVERGPVGREASWAGGGILSPLYPWRYPAAVTALASWSQRHYPAFLAALAADTGTDPEYLPGGLLILDTEEERPAQAWAAANGIALERLDGASAVQDREPCLRPCPGGALWMPAVGQVRNPRLVRALRVRAEQTGVRLREHAEVAGVLQTGGRVQGVRLATGEILAAATVVVAGGAWSQSLLGGLAEPLRVAPVRGQMILFRGPPGLLWRIVLAGGRYLIPRRDGRILAGSTLEHVGFDKSTTGEALQSLQASALDLVPALADLPVEHHWAGLRPGSPDGVPYVGAHPEVDGLFVNAGHYRNGVVLGLAAARLLADILLGRAPILAPEPYAWTAPRGVSTD